MKRTVNFFSIMLINLVCSIQAQSAEYKVEDTNFNTDSCVLNINQRSLEIGYNRIELGHTRFSEIKKIFKGRRLIQKKERTIIDLANGFFYVKSELFYPDLGIKFISSSGSYKGRSLFQNYRVNRFILEKNCKYKTCNGIGIGSTYQEITKVIRASSYDENPVEKNVRSITGNVDHSELLYSIRISRKTKLIIIFYGSYAKSNDEFVANQKIEIYVILG